MKKVTLNFLGFVFIVVSLTLFTSCNVLNSEDYDFEVYSNSPVKTNEYLKFGFKERNSNFIYEITYPDGSIKNGYEVESTNASFADAGTYLFKAYGEDNVKRSLVIEVISDSVTCTPPNNTLRSNVLNFKMNYYAVNGNSRSSAYEVVANSFEGDLRLTFNGSEKPEGNRTYVCRNSGSNFFGIADVEIKAVAQGGGSFYGKTNQPIHLLNVNGETHITMCDFIFVNNFGQGSAVADVNLVLE